jgi:hypothetical protein
LTARVKPQAQTKTGLDCEEETRRFYQLAAEHKGAAIMELREVLGTLAGNFAVAERPLRFLSEHCFLAGKHGLFGM